MTARIGEAIGKGHADVYCRTCGAPLGYVSREEVIVHTDLTTGRQQTIQRWFPDCAGTNGTITHDNEYAGYATRREALKQFKCIKCDKDKQ